MQKNLIKTVNNPFFDATYNKEELQYFSDEAIQTVLNFQKTSQKYSKTPLLSLPHLADYLNVGQVLVKDESKRFNLNAFKVMGGIYAMGKYISQKLGKEIESLTFEELRSEETKAKIGEVTFISATDGNHGRGVAWAARELGQKSVILMPKGSSDARLKAIQNEGAESWITEVNYDDTIRICNQMAEENGWVLVQDTAWEGYEEIPLWVMQGYSALAKEIIDEVEDNNLAPPTHLILQAGVGSFAAGVAAYFVQKYGADALKIFIVEPNQADCYYRSFANNHGNIEFVTGEMNSIMAGLCCGEPNLQAFRLLKQYASGFVSADDAIAALGMRVLGNPLKTDPKVVSGESGAVPLGLLHYIQSDSSLSAADKDLFGLDENSSVLVISTEGDTDPERYLRVVWEGKNPCF